MSVICQNFVQNAWKKDLCSNCFKSLGDHESNQDLPGVPHTCSAESNQLRNGISLPNGTRYISQATTIYQSRSLLNHATWTSILTDRPDKKNGFFQLENGFQGKLLTISASTTNGVEKKSRTNGYAQTPLTNGHSNKTLDIESSHTENQNGVLSNGNEDSVVNGNRAKVQFTEDGPLVIGYGGNDYDSDDQDWETESDDGDFPIESLDSCDEDRAITKITRENTEFNSDNANLLRGIDLTKKEAKKNRSVSNGNLPNGSSKETNGKNDREPAPPQQPPPLLTEEQREKDKNIARENVKNDDTRETENSGRKNSLYNGVHHTTSLPNGRRRDQAPPQASVKPFIRETPNKIEPKENGKIETQLEDPRPVITQVKKNSLPEIKEKIAPVKNGLIENQTTLTSSSPISVPIIKEALKKLEEEVVKPSTASQGQSDKPEKEGITKTDCSVQSASEIMSNVPREPNPITQAIAHARRSFLHGTPNEPIVEDPESAIYTPSKVDLFVKSRSSITSSDTTDSDSNCSCSGVVKIPKAAAPPLKCVDEGAKEARLAPLTSTVAVAAEPAPSISSPEEKRVSTGSLKEHSLPKGNLKQLPVENKVYKANSKATVDETQSDHLGSPESNRRSVTFASQTESDDSYPPSRRSSGGSSDSKDSTTTTNSSRSSSTSGEQPIYYAVSNTIIHTENISPVPHVATVRRTPVCHYAESNIYPEADPLKSSNAEKLPKNVREHKLAALAQELEQARLQSGNGSKRPAPSPPKTMDSSAEVSKTSTPYVTSQSTPSTPTPIATNYHKTTEIEDHQYGCINVYGKTSGQGHVSNGTPKGKSATISAVHGKKVLALLNFDESSAKSTSKKSGKFSIKKFLKRGKDMESLDHIFHQQQACSSPTTPNPKAWKNTEFDRAKLKLQIIHPMDMQHKDGMPISMQSTNEVINVSKPSYYGTSPASTPEKSPYQTFPNQAEIVTRGVNDGIYDDEATWLSYSDGNDKVSGNTDSPDTEQAAVTPMLSTFSPNSSTAVSLPSSQPTTPSTPTSHDLYQTAMTRSSVKSVRPPKPPPPPRLRSLTPGSQETLFDERSTTIRHSAPTTLPPKPQVPKRLFRPSMKSDYANLGDARTPVAPKKPDRFSNSRPSTPGCLESPTNVYYDDENAYELVGVECDSHYLSTSEQTDEAEPIYYDGSSLCAYDFYSKEQKSSVSSQDSSQEQTPGTTQMASASDRPEEHPNRPPNGRCGDKIQPLAWLSLEQSYAIVAAANHEVLAKLIDQIISKKTAVFQKPDGRYATWEDFQLQPSQPVYSVGEKTAYNATFKHPPKKEVTLLLTIQQATLPNRDSPSKHVFLGIFGDLIPRSTVNNNWPNQGQDMVQTQVYILPKSEIMSIRNKFFDKKLPTERNEALLFEKEFCFVYLQLIHALKILQAHGTEEIDLNHEDLILSKDEKDQMSNLVFLPGDLVNQDHQSSADKATLCQYALNFMLQALNITNISELLVTENGLQGSLSPSSHKIFITVAKVLTQEKASSLSKAKNLLEFHLWGPKENVYHRIPGGQAMEETFQRWLDIERAQNLRILVRSLQNISATEEHRLQFLVRTNAKVLKDLTSTLSFEKL